MKLTLKVWRQKNSQSQGKFVEYQLDDISAGSSFLEMLDILSEQQVANGEEPVAFDHDCREGICGSCSLTINGIPHGPENGTTACQLHMRHFHDGQTITIEPWRAAPFPVIKDLITDRTAFDRISSPGALSLPARGLPLMPTPARLPKALRIMRWMRQPALVVARAWPLARMHLRCCSPLRKFRT